MYQSPIFYEQLATAIQEDRRRDAEQAHACLPSQTRVEQSASLNPRAWCPPDCTWHTHRAARAAWCAW